jgi:hypothetical protein
MFAASSVSTAVQWSVGVWLNNSHVAHLRSTLWSDTLRVPPPQSKQFCTSAAGDGATAGLAYGTGDGLGIGLGEGTVTFPTVPFVAVSLAEVSVPLLAT